MAISLESATNKYLLDRQSSIATCVEYRATVNKWKEWGKELALESIGRTELREFIDWVYQRAIKQDGRNPERTANKCREHLRAVMSWAWEHELIEEIPRFPRTRKQRTVAGRFPAARSWRQ